MSEKKTRNESSETVQDLINEAAKMKTDRITVRTKKGMSVPLLSDWEAGDNVYRVVAIFADGVELIRIK